MMKKLFKLVATSFTRPTFVMEESYKNFKVMRLYTKRTNRLGSGSYGAFHDLKNGYGVKVFHSRYRSLEEAARNMQMAEVEFNNLTKAHKKLGNLAPTPVGIFIIRIVDKAIPAAVSYRAGMVIETISCIDKDEKLSYDDKILMQNALTVKLADIGIVWTDNHAGNWTITPDLKRVVVLDWGYMNEDKHSSKEYSSQYKKEVTSILDNGSRTITPEIKKIVSGLFKVA